MDSGADKLNYHSMTPTQTPLPEFADPPVSEVAIGVNFTPLEKWRSAHAGLYWSLIDKDYPTSEEKPPVLSQIEKFGDEMSEQIQQGFQLSFSVDPEMTRSLFISETGDYLIQVQRDRFIVNWRRINPGDKYPRYEKELRVRFEREWRVFKNFVMARGLGAINVRQSEITYLNDIAKGNGWNSFSEALSLVAQWLEKGSDGFLSTPESLMIACSFLMPERRGRLHFHAQHLIRQNDLMEVLQLNLTARGKPASNSDEDVLTWIDYGREWIVRGFADLTSKRAHELWKRIR